MCFPCCSSSRKLVEKSSLEISTLQVEGEGEKVEHSTIVIQLQNGKLFFSAASIQRSIEKLFTRSLTAMITAQGLFPIQLSDTTPREPPYKEAFGRLFVGAMKAWEACNYKLTGKNTSDEQIIGLILRSRVTHDNTVLFRLTDSGETSDISESYLASAWEMAIEIKGLFPINLPETSSPLEKAALSRLFFRVAEAWKNTGFRITI